MKCRFLIQLLLSISHFLIDTVTVIMKLGLILSLPFIFIYLLYHSKTPLTNVKNM